VRGVMRLRGGWPGEAMLKKMIEDAVHAVLASLQLGPRVDALEFAVANLSNTVDSIGMSVANLSNTVDNLSNTVDSIGMSVVNLSKTVDNLSNTVDSIGKSLDNMSNTERDSIDYIHEPLSGRAPGPLYGD
jgi:methyl-accepting chemotaxis protein